MRVDTGKTLNRHKIDMEIEIEEAIIGIAMVEIVAEIEVDRILGEIIVMMGVNQEKGTLHPEEVVMDGIIAQTQFQGLGSRSNLRVTTTRDRITCFRCREYDHFANECPNIGTNDSDGYESDSAALQLMTTDIEAHDDYDIARFTEEVDHLNL